MSHIQYDLEFKDLEGKSQVVSDEVTFATKKANERSYRLPLPRREFKVNKGREILVASVPKLTSADLAAGRAVPMVMGIPKIKNIKSWKFEITGPDKKLVRRFEGTSDIPENIYWDGRDERRASCRKCGKVHIFLLGDGWKQQGLQW